MGLRRWWWAPLAILTCACGGSEDDGATDGGHDAVTDAQDASDSDGRADDARCPILAETGFSYGAPCDECASLHCCDPMTACLSVPECLALSDCVKNCASGDAGTECTSTCSAAHPGGAFQFSSLRQCVLGSCNPECIGSF